MVDCNGAPQSLIGGPLMLWVMTCRCTGVDLSKKLGGQTQILGEQNVVRTDKDMGVFRFFGGRAPGLPPKSTPMCRWVPEPSHVGRKQEYYLHIHYYSHDQC